MYYYDMDHRVSYHEVDPNKKLTLPSLIDCFQDCGVFHGDDNGVSVDYLLDRDLSWVTSGYQVLITRMPSLDERITVSTAAYSFRLCMGFRNFLIRDAQGEVCAKADSQWVLMDMKKNTPFRVSEYMSIAYGTDKAEKLPDDFGGRKIVLEGERQEFEPLQVSRPMLDTNYHVNNGQYVHIAQSYLPEDRQTIKFRAEYKKQAHMGDLLYPVITQRENIYQAALTDENKETVFIGEWEYK